MLTMKDHFGFISVASSFYDQQSFCDDHAWKMCRSNDQNFSSVENVGQASKFYSKDLSQCTNMEE